jgi:predicted extracellular nuclease
MRRILLTLIVGGLSAFGGVVFSQPSVQSDDSTFTDTPVASVEPLRLAFYNVENFFDCEDDSLTADEEFLPGGLRGWTPTRFWQKAGHISRVMAYLRFPALVGLAEVENAGCLRRLTLVSPLKQAGYAFVHKESPDPRGIDVALLYNPYLFQPLHDTVLVARFDKNPTKRSRDVLVVKGLLHGVGVLYVFVCHLPSRLGGEKATSPLRRQVARGMRVYVDSLLKDNPQAMVLIMGDFNDEADSPSLALELGSGSSLYNLTVPMRDQGVKGTHKHQANWGFLDHLLVSQALLSRVDTAVVADPPFLLQADKTWLGIKPFRTYHGMVWQGGYSDHLPLYLDVKTKP